MPPGNIVRASIVGLFLSFPTFSIPVSNLFIPFPIFSYLFLSFHTFSIPFHIFYYIFMYFLKLSLPFLTFSCNFNIFSNLFLPFPFCSYRSLSFPTVSNLFPYCFLLSWDLKPGIVHFCSATCNFRAMAAATVTEDEPGSNKKHISDVEYHGRGGCIRCGDKVCDVDDHSGWLTAPDTVTLKDIRTPMAKHSRYEVARLSYQMKDGDSTHESFFRFFLCNSCVDYGLRNNADMAGVWFWNEYLKQKVAQTMPSHSSSGEPDSKRARA